jgi:deoxyadenosine/deoxycytidine kinase
MTIIISIDGNIGAGKTTLINQLKERFNSSKNIVFADEPVSEWEKLGLLQLFYSDKVKYSFLFQMGAFITRFKILKQLLDTKPKVIITERSLISDLNIFAQMLTDQAFMNETEFHIYKQFYSEFQPMCNTDYFIYVSTPVETCIERIKRRNRTGEENIPVDYLELCDHYHRKMVEKYQDKVIYVDQIENIYEFINKFE